MEKHRVTITNAMTGGPVKPFEISIIDQPSKEGGRQAGIRLVVPVEHESLIRELHKLKHLNPVPYTFYDETDAGKVAHSTFTTDTSSLLSAINSRDVSRRYHYSTDPIERKTPRNNVSPDGNQPQTTTDLLFSSAQISTALVKISGPTGRFSPEQVGQIMDDLLRIMKNGDIPERSH